MCGRYLLDVPGSSIANHFSAANQLTDFAGSWNAAPTQDLPVVLHDSRADQRVLEQLKWGLVPAWAVRKGSPMRPLINARSETIAEKPAFRDAFRKRRCVVPVSGFYEWHGTGKDKVPYCIKVVDEPLVPLAGIYEQWIDGNGELQGSYAIITTQPNETVGVVHDRMPAILDEEGVERWLETPPQEAEGLLELLRPWRGSQMEAYEVSKDVNSPANNHSGLAEPNAA